MEYSKFSETFYDVQTRDAANNSSWKKPAGCSMLFIASVGSGGGGGYTDAFGLGTVAGKGGGSGAIENTLIPAFLLPETLRTSFQAAGFGGTTSSTRTNSLIFVDDVAGIAIASPGSGGRGGANNPGGGGTISNAQFRHLGVRSTSNGATGGSTASGPGGNGGMLVSSLCGAGSGGGNAPTNAGDPGNKAGDLTSSGVGAALLGSSIDIQAPAAGAPTDNGSNGIIHTQSELAGILKNCFYGIIGGMGSASGGGTSGVPGDASSADRFAYGAGGGGGGAGVIDGGGSGSFGSSAAMRVISW